jgi:molybdate transport system ATP-binding protein
LEKIRQESHAIIQDINLQEGPENLIEFKNVNVGWDDHKVLVDLNWMLKKGEHWLIRGPNGSGKTTMLELITGDNMQVFREDIKLFGKRRGTGESIWDIKRQLGIVSYRLHVEYRMVGGTTLENVIVSGFKDSIGLYEKASDFEKATADQWLKLAGFNGRENESFSSLSYGEQRAVLILRAAVKRPRILILDEPCHGLDENYRQKVLDLIETVASTGTTTILHVTHDPSEVRPCEKHVLELHPGETPMYKILSL